MTAGGSTIRRAAVFALLSVLAVAWIVETESGDAHLARRPLGPPVNATQAAYIHALTSGFRPLAFKPGNGTVTLQSQALYRARSAFVLKAYAFLKKTWADPACADIGTVRIVPYGYFTREDGAQTLGPFAELALTRDAARHIDWSLDFPDIRRFKRALVRHGTLKFDRMTVP